MTEMNAIAKDNMVIIQRASDGYINATKLCKGAGKEWKSYHRSDSTKSFLHALSGSVQIPTDQLVKPVLTNVSNSEKGTYVHPKVAIHLAQWISPEFAVFVTEVIFNYISGNPMKIPPAMVINPTNAALRLAEINEELFKKSEEMLTSKKKPAK